MSETKKPPQSNSSRTVVIVVVAVLIVVAVVGIVLAGRRAPADAVVATAPPAIPAAPSLPGSTPQATSSPTDAIPSELVFAAASDRLPPQSADGLARFADAARGSASSVRLSARYLTGANKARDLELAKARTGAIRHALEANGVTSGKMQIELIEMPEGSLTEAAGNRIDLSLR